jgi:3'-phosphoadenosine 5'-phosphosulfate sulfotransferase (PAPS reductase)/FAD synthetase
MQSSFSSATLDFGGGIAVGDPVAQGLSAEPGAAQEDGPRACFYADYERGLQSSGAVQRFKSDPSFANAEALALAMYDVIHEVAPADAKFAIMSSAGKDSSACVHYYVESVLARIDAGKRYVPATVIMGSTGHEFDQVAARQKTEMEAINRFCWPPGSGRRVDLNAEIVGPRPRDTVLVELIGNGMALPAKAKNDAVVQASISNWCVDRVKRVPLEAAAARASTLAPIVIQVLGTRFGESTTRDASIRRQSAGLPEGLTRMGSGENTRMIGFMPILQWEDTRLIRNFVVNVITSYRPLDGNLELDQIYRDASTEESTATECAVQRTADGGFGGGCAGLASATRMGCFLCLKATNKALKNLADKFPERYALTYRLQEEINRHQERVHARPNAVKAAGFTSDTMFPKGFTFRTRYKWLVIVLAAEMQSGSRQLTDDQLAWIDRRWRRHGVFTVTTSDARKDAAKWLAEGATGEPPVFFDALTDFAGEFTESLGEGMPLGAFATAIDPDQDDLNLAHLLGLGMTGSPAFPTTLAYIFTDRSKPDHLFTMVTDEPAVMGTRTNTGLLNGMVGATLKCIGVRPASHWEVTIADGRHLFYHLSRERATAQVRGLFDIANPANDLLTAPGNGPDMVEWSLDNFVHTKGAGKASAEVIWAFNRGLGSTLAQTLSLENGSACGIDFEPITDSYFRNQSIADLAGRLTFADLKDVFKLTNDMVWASDTLQDTTCAAYAALIADLEGSTKGDWSLLSQENEAGAALRSAVRRRLKSAIFGEGDPSKRVNGELATPELLTYQVYLEGLKLAGEMYGRGVLNTQLFTRVAFIVRSGYVCPGDAAEYTVDLLRLLKIESRQPAGDTVPEVTELVSSF